MHIWLAIDGLSDRANTGNVTLAELLQYYNYGLANAFSTEISNGIDISAENAYNLFVDMEH